MFSDSMGLAKDAPLLVKIRRHNPRPQRKDLDIRTHKFRPQNIRKRLLTSFTSMIHGFSWEWRDFETGCAGHVENRAY